LAKNTAICAHFLKRPKELIPVEEKSTTKKYDKKSSTEADLHCQTIAFFVELAQLALQFGLDLRRCRQLLLVTLLKPERQSFV
jgi:hypothetical protein